MRSIVALLLAACGTAVVWGGWQAAHHRNDDWPVREQETITRTLHLSREPMRLVVQNVDGYVHVSGTTGSEVRVTAQKTVRAEADSDLAEAKRDVRLDFEEKPGSVEVSYDAPWICRGEQQHGCGDHHRRFYRVTYDLDIAAPASVRAVLSGITNGDIRLEKTTGDFEISGINGGIRLAQVSGSGRVRTINGPVNVQFAQNPRADTSFKSINGPIDITFQPNLAADLRFKTLNGEAYSDFDVTARTVAASQPERADGRFRFRSNGFMGARIGAGGPELSFETLNGSIYLRRAK